MALSRCTVHCFCRTRATGHERHPLSAPLLLLARDTSPKDIPPMYPLSRRRRRDVASSAPFFFVQLKGRRTAPAAR